MIELPFLNRRRLLLGLAAASSAAALPVAALAATDAVPVTENAELLRLGDILPAVAAKYETALRHMQTAFTEWNPLLPRCPVELRQSSGRNDEVERDLSGHGFSEDGHILYVTPAESFTWRREGCESALRRKRPRHPLTATEIAGLNRELVEWRRLETLALDYEAERAKVIEASGYDAAKVDHRAALETFGDLVRSIMAQPAEGMAGVIVQAQALEAWGTVPLLDQVLATVADKEGVWATRLAAAVLRIASA